MIFYKELFHKIDKILWSIFLKPFFFSFDPEKVHHFVVFAMKLFSPIIYLRKSLYHFKISGKNHPSLEKEVFGIKFPSSYEAQEILSITKEGSCIRLFYQIPLLILAYWHSLEKSSYKMDLFASAIFFPTIIYFLTLSN